MHHVHSGLLGWVWPSSVAAWAEVLGAVSTFAAVVVALAIAGRDGRRQRRADTWRQATQVSAWYGHVLAGSGRSQSDLSVVIILNGSEQPIYDACVSAGGQYGAALPFEMGVESNTCVTIIPPGRYRVTAPKGFDEGQTPGMHTRLDAAISFRDASGNFWRRDARGVLKKTRKDPLTELKIEQPLSWGEAFISQVSQVVRVEDPIPVRKA